MYDFLEHINDNFRIVLALVFSYLLTFISLPTIYRVAKLKKLYDIPDERKIHKNVIPRLGGMGIFAGFSLSTLFFTNSAQLPELSGIIAAVIIIFFIGMKDDILIIAPLTKLLGQLFAAFTLFFVGKIQITNLHGFFGIKEIPFLFSLFITIFTILVVTNAFNLIDGIDGLASALGIISALSFGIWFWVAKFYDWAVISFSLIGALLAFLPFNYSKKQKMFMGDTGALLIGMLLSVIAIAFNEKNLLVVGKPYFILPAPAVSFAILLVPLFDLLRVMYIRFLTKNKIFTPDQNHIHHIFLKLGFSHGQIVLILVSINLFFILLGFCLHKYVTIRRMILLILVLAMFIFYIPASIVRRKNKK